MLVTKTVGEIKEKKVFAVKQRLCISFMNMSRTKMC